MIMRKEIKEIKDKIVPILKKNKVARAGIFGSYARGKQKKDSDVDLIILSKKFAKMNEDERLKLLYRQAVGFPYDLHAYGFTPKEFNSASPLTALAEVRNKGIRIL